MRAWSLWLSRMWTERKPDNTIESMVCSSSFYNKNKNKNTFGNKCENYFLCIDCTVFNGSLGIRASKVLLVLLDVQTQFPDESGSQ